MADKTIVPHADGMDEFKLQSNEPVDDAPPAFRFDNFDGFVNELTGIGDWNRDKTYGGNVNGPQFQVRFMSGAEAENRWRGSDLGGRIVETIPDEMTREGVELQVQPDDDDDRADAAPEVAPAGAPQRTFLPYQDGPAIVEAMNNWMRDIGLISTFREALCYEIAYGGAGVLIGVKDNAKNSKVKLDAWSAGQLKQDYLEPDDSHNLTAPLNEENIEEISHLTAFRGGWDGELIAWRYYADPTHPKYGQPEIYMMRNLGVPIAAPPAPGERMPVATIPAGAASPFGPLIFFVHESRMCIFPGIAVSRRARVQMRGWGDSKFTRVNKILSDYDQTWGGVAILMQEFAQGILKVDGLSQLLSSKDPKAQGLLAQRAMMLQLTQSIARMRLIDTKEEFHRENLTLSGLSDVLDQFANRLAAAADMPVSLLMGQVKGGLGDASKGDIRFFYDRVRARQMERMMPQIHRLLRLKFKAKDSITKGKEPKRWSVAPNPLYKLTPQEDADLRNKQADTDVKYITATVLTPQEVTASRFSGSKWTAETTIDLEGRADLAKMYGEDPSSVKAPTAVAGGNENGALDRPAPEPSRDEPTPPATPTAAAIP